jgi:hypothetical protein
VVTDITLPDLGAVCTDRKIQLYISESNIILIGSRPQLPGPFEMT